MFLQCLPFMVAAAQQAREVGAERFLAFAVVSFSAFSAFQFSDFLIWTAALVGKMLAYVQRQRLAAFCITNKRWREKWGPTSTTEHVALVEGTMPESAMRWQGREQPPEAAQCSQICLPLS